MDADYMKIWIICLVLSVLVIQPAWADESVRLKELVKIQGIRDYPLIGYGVVVGLVGTGDSEKSAITNQSLVNALKNFDIQTSDRRLNSRNSAAVMVTAKMKSYQSEGDLIDVEVSSIGDARSLVGGTLIMSPLYGADKKMYALAQGAINVGAQHVESFNNRWQKNHPTAGRISSGAIVESSISTDFDLNQKSINLVLEMPDFTTASRIAQVVEKSYPNWSVNILSPSKVKIIFPPNIAIPKIIASLESLEVVPDYKARVVINEKTGVIVAGANIKLGEVTISHGDLEVEISNQYLVSQPNVWKNQASSLVSTVVVPETTLNVKETDSVPVYLSQGATVNDLVNALSRAKMTTRDMISILNSIKAAGALHADLIIQ
jgi:flagellar P-ring protein precursor FlgI